MELIKEIVKVVTQNSSYSLNKILVKNSKMKLLFEAVYEEKVKDDESAAQLIYNCSAKEKKYLMLKKSLIDKLSEILLCAELDHKHYTEYIAAMHWCRKYISLVEHLILHGSIKSAEKVLSKVKKKAQRYYVTRGMYHWALKKRMISMYQGESRLVLKYNKQVVRFEEYLCYETEAIGLWENLYSLTTFTIARSDDLAEMAFSFMSKISKFQKEYFSPSVELILLKIKSVYYLFSDDINGYYKNAQDKKDFLKKYKFLNDKCEQTLILFEEIAYFKSLKQYENSKNKVSEALNIATHNNMSWYIIQAAHFDVLIKNKEYNKAGEVLKKVYGGALFNKLHEITKSTWFVKESYLYFIYLCYEDFSAIKKFTPNFKNNFSISYFHDHTNALVKDKKGYNVQLLLIQVVLMYEKGMDNLQYAADNMKVYYYRYLKSTRNKRVKAFFRMLVKAMENDFQKAPTILKTKYLSILLSKSEPLNFDCVEIIPYEEFWSLIKNRLA